LSEIFSSGYVAVWLFVIISGFVITHLLLEQREDYARYIVRRFARIFPLFWVACILGAATLHLYPEALAQATWSPSALRAYGDIVSSQVHQSWAHAIAHAFMLHGAVPDNILPASQYAFSPPAWSLSLEWQFYLIAPLVIVLARKANSAALLAAASGFAAYLYFHGNFGEFISPSFLPAAAPMFAIGIGSRLLWPVLEGRITYPLTLAFGALALTPLASYEVISGLIWVAFLGFECADRRNLNGFDAPAFRAYEAIFRGRLPRYWGARSYSVYLIHLIILSIGVYVVISFSPGISQWQFLLLGSIWTVLSTSLAAALAYKLIERPGMALGRAIAVAINKKASISGASAGDRLQRGAAAR
jgi:peptidoglycan/LPS O-acetylase OafA/YrhL